MLMKTKAFTFELRVVSVLAAVFILVTAIGILTYRSLHGIVTDVKEATSPNTKIDLLKQVVVELTDAESSIKSYRLTKDDSYLTPFYESVLTIDERIEQLHSQSSGKEYLENLADSVETLIQMKYGIFNEILALDDNSKVTNELQSISRKLKDSQQKVKEKANEKKPNIFQRIFGAKKEKDSQTNDLFGLNALQKEVENTKTAQAKQIRLLNQKELHLSREDKVVMDKIRSVIQKMENFERIETSRTAIEITKSAQQTNFYIILFCVLASLLLGSSSFFIITYVQKNRAFRTALRNAKNEAETLAKTKETFLANMSHEIRTPMNAIAGFTNQVLQSKLTKKQTAQLQIVKKSSAHLLRIINDILDYSKIQSGKLGIESVGFKPSELLKDAAHFMQTIADEKNLKINTSIAKSVPEVFIGDPVRLRQIVLNLLGNAIKFTEKGKITVSALAVPQGSNSVALQVSVQDTGTGIPDEKLKTIFNEFEQADTSISRKYGGTGLGLTISRKLVEMQQGTIDIISKVGKGTKVSFIIPYLIGTETDIEVQMVDATGNGDLAGTKILVVDDEHYNRLLIQTILEKWGISPLVVSNGKEALEAIKENNFDIILMDVRMPVMNGIEATKAIQKLADKKKAKTPILALTATTRKTEIDECITAGMSHVVPKPFNENELYNLLLKITNHPKTDIKEEIMDNNAAKKGNAKFNLEELKQLANGDDAFVEEMIQVFINTTNTGLIDMEKALAEENWNNLADYAHKIVPPCRHLQANDLLKKLKNIELLIRDEGKTEDMEQLVAEAKTEATEIIALLEEELKTT